MITTHITRWFYTTVTIFLSIFMLTGCSMTSKEELLPPSEVKAMKLEAKTTPITMEFIGQVQALHSVEIRPQVSGFITEKFVNGGQPVTQGQLLYRINPQAYQLNVLASQARLADSEATLAGAQRDFERAKKLYAASAISLEEYQNSATQLERVKANVDASRSQLGISEIDLGYTEIRAPINGHLGTSVLGLGSYVAQGQTVLASISSFSPILVSFSLSEREYLYLMESQKNNTYNGQTYVNLVLENGTIFPEKGTITQVEAGLTQGTGSLNLKAEFPNASELLIPGMFAKVQAVVSIRNDAIIIPQRAVTDLMGKKMVSVITDGDKIVEKQVKIGAKLDNMYLIEDGLQAGEILVVEGAQKVAPGQTVKVEMLTADSFKPQAGK